MLLSNYITRINENYHVTTNDKYIETMQLKDFMKAFM